MFKFRSGDELLATDDRQWEDVEVPEWDSMIRIKGLTGTERDEFEDSRREGKGKKAKSAKDLMDELEK